MDTGLETRDGWLGMYVVRSVFWNYSDASLKMAKGLGKSGLLKIVLNDLDTYGIKSSKNEASEILHELDACIYFIENTIGRLKYQTSNCSIIFQVGKHNDTWG